MKDMSRKDVLLSPRNEEGKCWKSLFNKTISSVGVSVLIILRMKDVGKPRCVIKQSLLSLQLFGDKPVQSGNLSTSDTSGAGSGYPGEFNSQIYSPLKSPWGC